MKLINLTITGCEPEASYVRDFHLSQSKSS